jgi:hypothetical protein
MALDFTRLDTTVFMCGIVVGVGNRDLEDEVVQLPYSRGKYPGRASP